MFTLCSPLACAINLIREVIDLFCILKSFVYIVFHHFSTIAITMKGGLTNPTEYSKYCWLMISVPAGNRA